MIRRGLGRDIISGKKSQMAIFIILGIILVLVIVLFFVFRTKLVPQQISTTSESPASFIDSCINPIIKESVEKISPQGGYLNPEIYYSFDGIKRAYICYNANYYYPCVTQEPMYIKHLESEIKQYSKDRVKKCFDDLKINLERKGYSVNLKYNDFQISLVPGRVLVNADAEISYSRGDEKKNKKGFETEVPSMIYDVGVVVQEIASQEAKFCNFEYVGFMMYYPKFNIDKYVTGEDIKIYSVEHRETKEKIVFAIRSCVLPPGF